MFDGGKLTTILISFSIPLISIMSISYKFTKFEVKEIKKRNEKNTIPFWAQPTSKFEFHSTEAQTIKEGKMEESLGLGKKSYGTKTDTET